MVALFLEGQAGSDACGRTPWPAAIDQCGLGGKRAGWVLVLHLPGRAERRSVRLAATTNDAASLEAGAPGARRTSCAQDHTGEGLCYLNKGHVDPAFSSWLRA